MHFLRSPRTSIIAAVLLPVLLTGLVVLAVYLPGFSGRPPRDIGRPLFWLPPLAAVVVSTISTRVMASARAPHVRLWRAMFAVLLVIYFIGACSFGDRM